MHEIEAKTLLAHVPQPDTWFGLRYNLNLYRGCAFGCIYCDSRSACYGIERFQDVGVKTNAIARLRDELSRKRIVGTIGTGSMSDPYGPPERRYGLTGQALAVMAEFGFPVHVLTKSDLVLKDRAALQTINRVHAVVSFSLSTVDDDLARKLEPGAPPPSARLAAMTALAQDGIHTGVLMMPLLPFLTDAPEQVLALVEAAAAHGAGYILPGWGVTLRDRQRDHFYARLDRHFPGMKARYQRAFEARYYCPVRDVEALEAQFNARCQARGVATAVPVYQPAPQPEQLPLL